MKLQFSATQDYQLQAVQSVIDLFEGQTLAQNDFEVSFAQSASSLAFSEKGIGNQLVISEEQLLANVQAIQARNGIKVSDKLERCYYPQEKDSIEKMNVPKNHFSFANNFAIEMETGTGKTYTFLRTIYELNEVFGFKKFVIVVPSVAIREGTLKNLQITHEHFQNLYSNPTINYVMYDSKNLTNLRNFATSNAIQILVINIDSFTKDNNIINTLSETGVRPIEYIQATNPIVIIDEPQNFETDVRRQAIANLNPLCTLRYSATHKNLYNLLYSLNPVQAYDLGLVKQIEVDGIEQKADVNTAYIKLLGFEQGKRSIKAIVNIHAQSLFDIKEKKVKLSVGDDLFELSGGKSTYQDRYILNSINAQEGKIEFGNGIILYTNQELGKKDDEIIKYQIERTVHHHFEKEYRYWKREGSPVKVISLFFIDRVANYRDYQDGNVIKGKFAVWFEEIFEKYVEKYKQKYLDLFVNPPSLSYFESRKVHETDIPQLHPEFWNTDKVHNGYFSADKKGVLKDTKGNTKDDEDTYSLIMKDKERLLSLDEPLRFIFSHSALREGWDNPNVFQICTLNESKSEIKKRQEIGRGLRLSVDSLGQRVYDKRINILTIIANESYESFSKALQSEIQEETSVDFSGRIANANTKVKIQLNKELKLENYPYLFEIWEKISQKTRYSVHYNTQDLIDETVKELQDLNKVPPTKRSLIKSNTMLLTLTNEGIGGQVTESNVQYGKNEAYQIPDIYNYIQSRLHITRSTIFKILQQSGRINEIEINPQIFLDNVVATIQRVLDKLSVNGIKYTTINDKRYEMSLFQSDEIETYLANLFQVQKTDKTLFNYIPIDSTIESQFAKDCETDPNIKFFFKLPKGFKIPTPMGNYIPDWAVVFEFDTKIYFVAETKSSLDRQLLRNIEQMKIECGEKHFALFKPLGVEYKVVTSLEGLY